MGPATDWKEIIPDGESARFERYAVELRAIQRRHAAKSGSTRRALHAKGKAGVEGELTVLPGLPEYARFGLFAEPATYRAYVRFSNGGSRVQADARPDVRGVAVKVVGVGGKKIIPGLEDAKTQDFLLIKSAATPFRDADEFVSVVRAADAPALGIPRLIGHLGFGRAVSLLRQLTRGLAEPVTSVATLRYYSALPVKYGPYAVHYALFPHLQTAPATAPEHLGEELSARLRGGPVSYDLRVQFYTDEKHTPIEDASVEWLESDAPFLTVARLVLPQQDTASKRGRRVAELCEGFAFDPWHTTADFRPLGNMMRARNHAYRLSTQERGASPEPDGTEALDG